MKDLFLKNGVEITDAQIEKFEKYTIWSALVKSIKVTNDTNKNIRIEIIPIIHFNVFPNLLGWVILAIDVVIVKNINGTMITNNKVFKEGR